jgi:hypothetical protein
MQCSMGQSELSEESPSSQASSLTRSYRSNFPTLKGDSGQTAVKAPIETRQYAAASALVSRRGSRVARTKFPIDYCDSSKLARCPGHLRGSGKQGDPNSVTAIYRSGCRAACIHLAGIWCLIAWFFRHKVTRCSTLQSRSNRGEGNFGIYCPGKLMNEVRGWGDEGPASDLHVFRESLGVEFAP